MSNESKICVYCAHSEDAPQERQTTEEYLVCCVAAPGTDADGRAFWPLVKSEHHCGQFSPGQMTLDVVVMVPGENNKD